VTHGPIADVQDITDASGNLYPVITHLNAEPSKLNFTIFTVIILVYIKFGEGF